MKERNEEKKLRNLQNEKKKKRYKEFSVDRAKVIDIDRRVMKKLQEEGYIINYADLFKEKYEMTKSSCNVRGDLQTPKNGNKSLTI